MSKDSTKSGAVLERYLRHWRERGAMMSPSEARKETPPLTIALSRECGAGGKVIATAIGEKLGWPVYDRELVEIISEDTGVHAELLESIDEKSPHWLTECLDGFRHEKTISGAGFAIRLLKSLFALAGHGNCIIIGRGAAQVLPEKGTFRLRLIAPEEDRVAYLCSKNGMDVEQATKHAAQVDQERASFVSGYYHKDITDQHHYDLIINPLRFGTEQTTALILMAIEGYLEKMES